MTTNQTIKAVIALVAITFFGVMAYFDLNVMLALQHFSEDISVLHTMWLVTLIHLIMEVCAVVALTVYFAWILMPPEAKSLMRGLK